MSEENLHIHVEIKEGAIARVAPEAMNDPKFVEAMNAMISAAVGTAIRNPDGSVFCNLCGSECDWEPCHAACDDGYFDGYEEDPLWYDEGDLVPCPECRGMGGSYWCPDKACKTGEVRTIVKRPPSAEGGSSVTK